MGTFVFTVGAGDSTVIPNRKLKSSNDDVAKLIMVAEDLISPGTTI
jgi:hypothetical protein